MKNDGRIFRLIRSAEWYFKFLGVILDVNSFLTKNFKILIQTLRGINIKTVETDERVLWSFNTLSSVHFYCSNPF